MTAFFGQAVLMSNKEYRSDEIQCAMAAHTANRSGSSSATELRLLARTRICLLHLKTMPSRQLSLHVSQNMLWWNKKSRIWTTEYRVSLWWFRGSDPGTNVRPYHIFPIPVFRFLLRTCPDEPQSAGQFEDNCPLPNLFRSMKKAFNFIKYSFLFECTFVQVVVRNERFWPPGVPPKRKVVGSNPARNANLKGGDRKNRFPLLLSQKTISV